MRQIPDLKISHHFITAIKGKEGGILSDLDEANDRWKEYTGELYDREGKSKETYSIFELAGNKDEEEMNTLLSVGREVLEC